jgi:hypothetical protein
MMAYYSCFSNNPQSRAENMIQWGVLENTPPMVSFEMDLRCFANDRIRIFIEQQAMYTNGPTGTRKPKT